MPTFVALLRAVNVGGTGKLPMAELESICENAGFTAVRTYIASGNVVFDTAQSALQVKAALEQSLLAYAGKPVAVMVRSASEMRGGRDQPPPTDTDQDTVYSLIDREETAAPRQGC